MTKRPKAHHKNRQRQKGSLKVWYNEVNKTVWESVVVHHGRVTRAVRGPEAKQLEVAHERLSDWLKIGI